MSTVNVTNLQEAGLIANVASSSITLLKVNISGAWVFVQNYAQGGVFGLSSAGANISLNSVVVNISIYTKQQNDTNALTNQSKVGIFFGQIANGNFTISIVNCTSYFSANYT